MGSTSLRTIMVTSHVTTSVGWLGAVLAFLVLSVAAVESTEVMTRCSAYVAMGLIGWVAILPLAVGSFVSGMALGLGTEWGLIRHRWILTKLIATTALLIGLVVHQTTAVSRAAELARGVEVGTAAIALPLDQLGWQLVIDAGFAAVFLIGITALSFIKPWGRTRLGGITASGTPATSRVEQHAGHQMRVVLALVVGLVLVAFVVLHVFGSMGQHSH